MLNLTKTHNFFFIFKIFTPQSLKNHIFKPLSCGFSVILSISGKEKLFNATSLMAAIEANRGQKPVTQSGQSTEEKTSPLVNPNTEVKDPLPVRQPCSQSERTEQNNSADIMPPWLEAKRRALFSPQDVIVIQDDSDVEMEDQENKVGSWWDSKKTMAT